MGNNVKEILHNALEDLLEDQFKEFKWRLRNLDHKRKIPAAQLEKADKMDVADLLCSFYGEDNAGSVCIGILEALHLKGAAGDLRETIQNGASFEGEVAHHPKRLRSASMMDYRSTYMDYIKEKFQTMKDGNSLPGESVLLNERFSKLIIVDHRPKEAREHEIMTSGWQHAQIMRIRDSHSITVPTLFKCDQSGQVPDIVVLQGAAGIGKTMTARKIMLDWACGELYRDIFDYVFYIHCREMNLYKEQSSIADLLFKQLPSEDAIKELLRNPQKLLFIIDGFDELRFCIDQPEDHLCNNPWKKQSMTIVLSSLFRKKILPKSHLLITTRPTALEKLCPLLGRSRYAEILGFSPEDRREYFQKFFPNKDQAEKAFRLVQQNEVLFTMCFVPIICWIICTVLKEELDASAGLVQSSNTITAIYMRYLLCLIKPLKNRGKGLLRTNLRGLCSLAEDGIWKREILFGEEEMQKYGLDHEDFLPLFLNENIFKRDIECICAYSFIHLSFQEFFAALSYVLEEEEEDALSLEKRNHRVRMLLESYRTSRQDLVLTVRFLFGLLNEEKRMKALKQRLGWKMSKSVKELLLQWVTSTTTAKIACSFSYKPELFGFLFEIQDEDFLNSSLDHVTEVKLNRIVLTEMEEVILAFCLKNCRRLEILDSFACSPVQNVFEKDLRKNNQEDDGEEYRELLSSSQLQSDQKPYLYRLKLWVASSVMGNIQRFLAPVKEFLFQWKGLFFFWRGLFIQCRGLFLWSNSSCSNGTTNQDAPPGPFQRVCEALTSLNSTLTRIRLHGCHLTAACGSALSLVLINNPTLSKLDLGQNELGDAAMKHLCEGLKHPNCRILELLLHQCQLTSACCETLSSVFCINQTLIELNLQGNNIGDSGMSLLCEGLKQPNCRLQKLHLDRCGLTAACCPDLSSVLCSNQALAELHLSTNKLEDSGVRILCQGLKHTHSRLRNLLLHWCDLTAVVCGDLASVVSTNQNLTKLCLSWNTLGDSGVSQLCEGLRHPDCRLQHLILTCCGFTAAPCADLASVFSNNSSLQFLEFWENDLGDLGVNMLCEGLKHPNCNLENLTFKRCNITSACCGALASVLMNNPSLKWLHFSEEKLGDAGVSLLCEGLRHPKCKLQKLMFWQCDLTAACCEDLAAVLCSNQCLRELKIWNSKLGDAGVKLLCRALEHPNCKLQELTLSNCELSETSCVDLSSVLSTNNTLTHLKLDYNELGDSGLRLLNMGLKHPNCRVQRLSLTKCNLTSACCEDLSSLLSTSQTLLSLYLDVLEMGESEARLLRKGIEDPNCKLQSLMFRFGIVNEKARQELGAVKKTKPDLDIDLW